MHRFVCCFCLFSSKKSFCHLADEATKAHELFHHCTCVPVCTQRTLEGTFLVSRENSLPRGSRSLPTEPGTTKVLLRLSHLIFLPGKNSPLFMKLFFIFGFSLHSESNKTKTLITHLTLEITSYLADRSSDLYFILLFYLVSSRVSLSGLAKTPATGVPDFPTRPFMRLTRRSRDCPFVQNSALQASRILTVPWLNCRRPRSARAGNLAPRQCLCGREL